MNELRIDPVPAFRDNYLWLLHRESGDAAAVVDPGDDQPVMRQLERLNLRLSAVLITHHHPDHTGGLRALMKCYPEAVVYGPAGESIAGVHHRLREDDRIALDELGVAFRVLDVPGHTSGHIAYVSESESPPLLFCGDTLFAVGCGRLFEGTAGQLYASLNKLAGLSAETKVFCAHEYTLNNIRFAKQVEPDNLHLLDRELRVQELRARQLPTLPSVLSEELHTNPFLRVEKATVAGAVANRAGRRLNDAGEVFAELRRWKDQF